MTPEVAKKPRNKPPKRRVPPGENRTARNYVLGVAVSLEEKAAINAIGKGLGFRSGGPLVGWVLGNLFELSKNPLHLPIWQMDLYARLRKAGVIAPDEKMPDFAGEIFPVLAEQFGAAIDKAFGASEKREPDFASGASVPGGERHGST